MFVSVKEKVSKYKFVFSNQMSFGIIAKLLKMCLCL